MTIENDGGRKGFDFDTARNYWKNAPSGKGKCDTSGLLGLDDETFYAQWDSHFRSRLIHYWEDRLMVGYFVDLFKGKRILSFGSGIGHNEIQFLENGAQVVCADIVQSNLDVIDRVCRVRNLNGCTTLFMEDSANTDFDGPFDHIYVRGSLMTMPEELQARALENFRKVLKPGGMIILNLYTWEFVRQTCNVDDPIEFAKASDPSVGSLDNPWSDWHDDEKLQRLAGPGLYISHRQFWNQGQYVWYALSLTPGEGSTPAVREFLDLDAAENAQHNLVHEVKLSSLKAQEAGITRQADAISVRTSANNCLYAVNTKKMKRKKLGAVDKLSVDMDLLEGVVSIGVLDIKRGAMAFAGIMSLAGRHTHHFRIPSGDLPEEFMIIISNHRPEKAAESVFVVHHLKLWKSRD